MKRVYWVDWLKFIGIFLVVLGHLPDNEICNGLIYSFHMPLFFIISGFLMDNQSKLPFKKTLIKDFKTLIIPYFLWNTITVICIFIFQRDHIYSFQSIFSVYGNFPAARPSWFLVTLFLAKTIINSFSLPNKKDIILILFIILLLAIMSFIPFIELNYNKFATIIRTIIALPFLLFGLYVKRLFLKGKINIKLSYLFFQIPIFLIIALLNKWPNMFLCSIGNNGILFFIEGILGTTILYTICKTIKRTPLYVITISNGTLLILCIHRFFICDPYIKYISPKINFIPDLLSSIIVSIFTLLVCYLFIIIALKYCPILIGKYKSIPQPSTKH